MVWIWKYTKLLKLILTKIILNFPAVDFLEVYWDTDHCRWALCTGYLGLCWLILAQT